MTMMIMTYVAMEALDWRHRQNGLESLYGVFFFGLRVVQLYQIP